jgi:hypothetical protein
MMGDLQEFAGISSLWLIGMWAESLCYLKEQSYSLPCSHPSRMVGTRLDHLNRFTRRPAGNGSRFYDTIPGAPNGVHDCGTEPGAVGLAQVKHVQPQTSVVHGGCLLFLHWSFYGELLLLVSDGTWIGGRISITTLKD